MHERSSGSDTIRNFLDRVEVRSDDEVSSATYQGRALSRSREFLHLAIETGVLAIPIDSIRNVEPLSERTPQVVRVEVSKPDQVKRLLEVRPPLPHIPNPTPGIVLRAPETTDSENSQGRIIIVTVDTATITAGVPDATDDFTIPVVILCW